MISLCPSREFRSRQRRGAAHGRGRNHAGHPVFYLFWYLKTTCPLAPAPLVVGLYTAESMCGNVTSHLPPPVRPAASTEDRPGPKIALQPVDSLTITTLVDNVYDVFMPDHESCRRSGPGSGTGRLPLA